MTRVIAYLRVSTEKQANEGVSLDVQRRKLEAHAIAADLEIVAWHVDEGASAKSLDRPALRAALADLEAGRADGLLVAKLDRLTRSVKDLGELVDRYFAERFALLSLGDSVDTRSAAGHLVLNVLASVSQWEREAIAERTSSAMRHMREHGLYTGGRPPFGYRVEGGKLVEDPAEQKVVRLARWLKANGMSLRRIASELERAGYRSRTASGFAPAQVARMVSAA